MNIFNIVDMPCVNRDIIVKQLDITKKQAQNLHWSCEGGALRVRPQPPKVPRHKTKSF